jgi:lipoyl(octanoyl) transferase
MASKIEDPQEQDYLLLTEHPPVYTLGTGSNLDNLKFDPRFNPDLVKTERGGEVTYHCPGQLVMYPILNLKFHQTDLHWYLRQLEAIIIETIAHWGLSAERIDGLTGVWLEGKKVAAIGIKVSRWITMHGCAINVCPDLTGFNQIIPCGISHKPVGKLEEFNQEITMEGVKPILITKFQEKFNLQIQRDKSH